MIAAGTGHRPPTLGLTYKTSDRRILEQFALDKMRPQSIIEVISGMANGWDQAIVYAAIELKIPFTAVVPFKNQEAKWPKDGQAYYNVLLSKAKQVVVVCEGGYANWKFIERDRWMVNHCDIVMALWNGTKCSGTGWTIRYAQKQNKQIINLWEDWEKWLALSKDS